MKWAIELGENEIEYHPRKEIKGQLLADFLVELDDSSTRDPKDVSSTPDETPGELWHMYVDRASQKGQCGAGVLLISPKGIELSYARRLRFEVTNNEAEYEALYAGLKLALQMEATKISVFGFSYNCKPSPWGLSS